AVTGALAEWGLACWLLGIAPSPAWHVVVLVTLALVNRRAARQIEDEGASGFLAGRGGQVAMATAFGALAAAGAVVAAAAGWAARFGAGAGIRAGVPPEPLLGGAFRWAAGLAVGLTGVAVADGYARGYRRLVVTSLTVPLRGLRAPIRLVHVSDLHLGPLA